MSGSEYLVTGVGRFQSLPDIDETVVVLRDFQGLSYEEVIRVTGYNMGTLKSKLARARMQLRQKLKGVV